MKTQSHLTELILNFQYLICLIIIIRESNFCYLPELSSAIEPFSMMKKMQLNFNFPFDNNLNITDITPLENALGKMTIIEWLDLRFKQNCTVAHLNNINGLGNQLQKLKQLKYFHLNLR